MDEVTTAHQSPFQNPYAERIVGSIRRECLDHVIVLNEKHLRAILRSYLSYYHEARAHLSLGAIQSATGFKLPFFDFVFQ